MKKISVLITALIIALTGYSQNTEQLSSDYQFAEYVKTMNQMGESLVATFTREELRSFTSIIEKKKAENLTNEQQLAFVVKLFRLKSSDEFNTFYSTVVKDNNYIRKTYPSATKEVLTNAAANVLQNNATGRVKDCGWRYALCAAGVGVTGGAMLLACEAASAGMATILCVAGVATFTANGLADCKDDHCK